MTPTEFRVGRYLTLVAEGVLVYDHKGEPLAFSRGQADYLHLSYATIDAVTVRHHATGEGARLVISSPETVFATDFPEAWIAHRTRRNILHAMNARDLFTLRQRSYPKGDPR